MSDEITIIPQGRNTQKTPTTSSTNKPTSVASAQKKPPAPADDDIIELDDEEEIDDVEDEVCEFDMRLFGMLLLAYEC